MCQHGCSSGPSAHVDAGGARDGAVGWSEGGGSQGLTRVCVPGVGASTSTVAAAAMVQVVQEAITSLLLGL